MNIVLLEPLGVSDKTLNQCAEKFINAGHSFKAYEKSTDTSTLIERAKDADIIMLANMPLKGEVIEACSNLKFISVAFTGVDHIDLEAARKMGVKVSNAAGYSTQAVAELSICMMLSLLRNVDKVQARCRMGGTKDGLVGEELGSKVVGIIGAGAIGTRVANICKAFGSKVIAYAPRPKENGLDYVSLDELLQSADIISLHCPLNPSSKSLINAERIAMMKQGAILINAARGPVVDSEALAQALNSGKISGAGIDVYEIEPPLDIAHPLLHSQNTITTPHIAFASKQSLNVRAKIVFDNISSWQDGKQINIIL